MRNHITALVAVAAMVSGPALAAPAAAAPATGPAAIKRCWLRRALALRPTLVSWHDVVQAGLSLPGPMALGLVVHDIPAALFGSLDGLLAERSGTNGQRMARIGAASAGGVVAKVLGPQTASTEAAPPARGVGVRAGRPSAQRGAPDAVVRRHTVADTNVDRRRPASGGAVAATGRLVRRRRRPGAAWLRGVGRDRAHRPTVPRAVAGIPAMLAGKGAGREPDVRHGDGRRIRIAGRRARSAGRRVSRYAPSSACC
jgi:hypothetical protein